MDTIERLRKFLTDEWDGSSVRFAYVFGSTVTGRGWKTTRDLDVAVWFKRGYRIEERERLREELERKLGVPCDVVVLNDAPPLLRYEVLRYGRLLCSSDEGERVEREVRMLLEYYDLEPMRNHMEQSIQRMIREGTF